MASGRSHGANGREFAVEILTYHLLTCDLPPLNLTSLKSILSHNNFCHPVRLDHQLATNVASVRGAPNCKPLDIASKRTTASHCQLERWVRRLRIFKLTGHRKPQWHTRDVALDMENIEGNPRSFFACRDIPRIGQQWVVEESRREQ